MFPIKLSKFRYNYSSIALQESVVPVKSLNENIFLIFLKQNSFKLNFLLYFSIAINKFYVNIFSILNATQWCKFYYYIKVLTENNHVISILKKSKACNT